MARTPQSMADQLRKLKSPAFQRRIAAGLQAGGEIIQRDAQISITTGAVSGAGHIASLPGDAPNADTHFLANNIETTIIRDTGKELKVEVSSNAPYSDALENGTSRIAARPFMVPATEKNRGKVVRSVRRYFNRIVRETLA